MDITLPSVKEFIKKHDLTPQRKLGQNFLLDQNITDKIVSYAGDLHDKSVVEIGPGPGGLTRSILNAGARDLHAIELDKRCFIALHELEEY
jgi:16S rRNA (adenine1518-N6/adenine1519-N6)-dimethyltransferase